MKNIITLVFSLYLVLSSSAQIFHKKYTYSSDIMQVSTSVVNGSFIYTASNSTFMQGMFSIQKTDLNGNWKITKTIFMGTSIPSISISKMITSGSRLYIVGSTKPGSNKDGFLAVVDTALNSVYYRSFGTSTQDEEFNDVTITSNNDLVMVGYSTVPSGTVSVPKYAQYIVRATSATGNVIYQKTFEDFMSKIAYSVYEDAVNNALYIAGNVLSTTATFVSKLTNDNLGNVSIARIINFPSTNMLVRKISTIGNKLFLLGGDASNFYMKLETDLNLNVMSVNPVIHTNFKYGEMIKVNKTNYLSGVGVPTGTVQSLIAMAMDSLFNIQSSTQYSLVAKPVSTNWYSANVVNKNNTMYWVMTEAWTAPTAYTNRYVVASDLMLNAICNTPYAVTTQTTMQYITPTTYTTAIVVNTATMIPMMMNSYTPSVTTLCSATGIENVNENFEKFVIKNGTEKVIIESPYNEYVIQLFDIAGKIVFTKKSDSQTEELNLESLSNGIYIVKLNAEGFEQRQKIIKQ